MIVNGLMRYHIRCVTQSPSTARSHWPVALALYSPRTRR